MYRSLEVLEENFVPVEQYLYSLAVKKFKQVGKELYYDITSSYFEGHKCIIAEYGYSRDKRKDRKQIVIGLVTTSDGFPIKCNIYPGNRVDKTTVQEVLQELRAQYPLKELVFVGDRGMLTAENISAIEKMKQKYVMAIPRAWSKKYLKDVAINEETMRKIQDDLYAVFLPFNESRPRLLLCLNIKKREDDTQYRLHCIEAIEKELDKLNASLGKNKGIATRDEAMKRAGMILKLNYARKYFRVQTIDSINNSLGFEVHYEINEAKVEDEQRLDGTFVIQSNEKDYADEKLVKIYKNLSKVENAFKILKNDLDIRPLHHRKENRVKGHVYVCVLAYFLIAAIKYIASNYSAPKK